MIDYQQVLSMTPYGVAKEEKGKMLSQRLWEMMLLHYEKCASYRNMLDAFGFLVDQPTASDALPFLPVSLFKTLDLFSVAREDIFKTMTSSGTTGQAVSKIYLDRNTAANQQKTLAKIVTSCLGGERLPMLIIDSPSVVKDRAMFSARGAGILGFSIFGTDRTYALDENMRLNVDSVTAFLEKHRGQKILLFGFTFMVWQHFYKELIRLNGQELGFSNATLIHGGGWKKLASEAISADAFKKALREACGIFHVYDYYGMVEQTGCVYMECERGHLHASSYSDIIMRRAADFSPCEIGEPGIIQVLSMLPESYPGHSLLTEDEGVILGEDDCPCGRKGKYFRVLGRVANAEIRGCSDTYAAEHQ